MKKFLLASAVFCGALLAQDCDKFDCTSDSEGFAFDMQQGVAVRTFTLSSDFDTDNGTTTRRSYNNRIELNAMGLGIHTDIDLYDMTRPLGKLHNVSLAYEDDKTYLQTGYQINSLYLSYELTDNISLYHGAMPFKGGHFSEIKDPTINGGNGLAIINNQVYSSNFISYHDTLGDGKYSLIAGRSEFNTKNKYNGLTHRNEGSSGTYIIGMYESGKHFFEADYYAMKVNMDPVQDYAALQIGGVGYIYDDSMDSGVTLYTNLGMSSISEDVVRLMNSYGIVSAGAVNYYKTVKKAHTTDTENVKGYAGLFGGNYEFDTMGKTFNIGSEVFITRGGWVSANHGVAFLSDHSWYANRNAIESTIYAGCNITKNLRVSAKYVATDSRQVVNAFAISQNEDPENALNGNTFSKHFQKTELLLNYTF